MKAFSKRLQSPRNLGSLILCATKPFLRKFKTPPIHCSPLIHVNNDIDWNNLNITKYKDSFLFIIYRRKDLNVFSDLSFLFTLAFSITPTSLLLKIFCFREARYYAWEIEQLNEQQLTPGLITFCWNFVDVPTYQSLQRSVRDFLNLFKCWVIFQSQKTKMVSIHSYSLYMKTKS